jgi:hypothetical protein
MFWTEARVQAAIRGCCSDSANDCADREQLSRFVLAIDEFASVGVSAVDEVQLILRLLDKACLPLVPRVGGAPLAAELLLFRVYLYTGLTHPVRRGVTFATTAPPIPTSDHRKSEQLFRSPAPG